MKSGDVVVLEFPFSDLSGSKTRPALILAAVGSDDYVACQITSNAASDPKAIRLDTGSFSAGKLKSVSFVRPGKLFTAHRSLVLKIVGRVTQAVRDQAKGAVIAVIQNG